MKEKYSRREKEAVCAAAEVACGIGLCTAVMWAMSLRAMDWLYQTRWGAEAVLFFAAGAGSAIVLVVAGIARGKGRCKKEEVKGKRRAGCTM